MVKHSTLIIIILTVLSIMMGGFLILTIRSWNMATPSSDLVKSTRQQTTYRIALLGHSQTIDRVFSSFRTAVENLFDSNTYHIDYIILKIPYTPINISHATDYLKSEKPDLIVTGMSEYSVLKDIITDIPILIALSSEPLDSKKTKSGSGTNVAFTETGNNVSIAQRLEYFLDIVPSAKTILVLRGADDLPGINQKAIIPLRKAAQSKNITLVEKSFSSRSELNKFFLSFQPDGYDALLRYPDAFIAANIDIPFFFGVQHKLPFITLNRHEAEEGGILSYSRSDEILGQVNAQMAYDILVNKKFPGAMPIIQPEDFELGINLKAAAELGIVIPPTILKKTDYLIR